MKETQISPSAWYSNFWPWFILVLLGISVIASLYTVSIAYSLGDIESPAEAPSTAASQPIPKTSPAAEH